MSVRIVNIAFDADEQPSEITLTLSIKDAALITKHAGMVSPAQVIPADASPALSEFYDCLIGRVFNNHWEDGVDGYLNGAQS